MVISASMARTYKAAAPFIYFIGSNVWGIYHSKRDNPMSVQKTHVGQERHVINDLDGCLDVAEKFTHDADPK